MTQPDGGQVLWLGQGTLNSHLIVNFDAKNSNFLALLSIFPRGAARVSRAWLSPATVSSGTNRHIGTGLYSGWLE